MQLYVTLCLERQVDAGDLLSSGHAGVNPGACSYMVRRTSYANAVWIDDDTGKAHRLGPESPRKRICMEKEHAIYGMGVLRHPTDSPLQHDTFPATLGNVQVNKNRLFMAIQRGDRTAYFLLRSPAGALIGDVQVDEVEDAVCPSLALFDGNLHMFRLRVHQLQAHHDAIVTAMLHGTPLPPKTSVALIPIGSIVRFRRRQDSPSVAADHVLLERHEDHAVWAHCAKGERFIVAF